MPRRSHYFYLPGLIFLIITLLGTPAWAQQFQGGREVAGTSFYTFARPGQNTIEVLVLGSQRAGIYQVAEDINLAKLLALSGGTAGTGRTKVRLYRPQSGERKLLFESEMEDFVSRSQYPDLQANDIVQIEAREKQFTWRDVLQIFTSVSALAYAVDRLFDI